MLTQMLATRQVKCSDDLDSVRRSGKTALQVTDEYWHIEDSLFQGLAGATAEQRASAMVTSLLPTPGSGLGMKEVLGKLQTLSASAAMNMSPLHVQASLSYIVKVLTNLTLGLPLTVNCEEITQMAQMALKQLWQFLDKGA